MQTSIPCVIMRGGTSRGPFFLSSDLPADAATRDAVLLAVMGSPHEIQVDGIGGANSVTSKVAIISKSKNPGADVDYLFAQVEIDRRIVDTKPNCGNMLVAVGPFAIESGLVPANDGETLVRIFNVNTQSLVESIVQTPGGDVTYEGDAAIDGVAGTAAPVKINFKSAIGAVTGKLLPTGKPLDIIDGVEVSCVDVAMPVILMRAEAFGKTGHETAVELDADKALFERMEAIRRKAGVLMGMGDVSKLVVPKIALLSKPRKGGTIASRFFVPDACHKAHPVTGTVCIASACAIPGTIASQLAALPPAPQGMVRIEHPSGKIAIDLDVDFTGGRQDLRRAALIRTARRVFEGASLVPSSVWAGASQGAAAGQYTRRGRRPGFAQHAHHRRRAHARRNRRRRLRRHGRRGHAGRAATLPVTVFEAGKQLGGRARRVDHRDIALDNGLHILIGAYRETLRLIRAVNPDACTRRCCGCRWPGTSTANSTSRRRGCPRPLHLLIALADARAASAPASVSRRCGFLPALKRGGYRLDADISVELLLKQHAQSEFMKRVLWRPLCVAALNTPPAFASAQVFSTCCATALNASRAASDLLLSRVDLSALFPEPAAEYVKRRGGSVLTAQRVTAIDVDRRRLHGHRRRATPFVQPRGVRAAAASGRRIPDRNLPRCRNIAAMIEQLHYQPIYSVWLQYPSPLALPSPMLGFAERPASLGVRPRNVVRPARPHRRGDQRRRRAPGTVAGRTRRTGACRTGTAPRPTARTAVASA